MSNYTKPYLDIDEQIQKLKSRGMEFKNEDEAHSYLKQIGYYRLSGFWYPFRQSRIFADENGKPKTQILDQFRENTSFDGAIRLYVFDKKIRLLLVDALERIEVALRTCIALRMGSLDPWSYRDANYLDGRFCAKIPYGKNKTKFQTFTEKCDHAFDKSREDFVVHFKQNYQQKLPIWAAVELWDFGTLSVFLEGMKYADKRHIANEFGIPRPELLPTWVRSLAFVRNICAHHARLWNKPLIAQPKTPKVGEIPFLEHLIGDSYALQRPYSVAAITRFLLLQINPTSQWNKRWKDVVDCFPSEPGISLGQAGFPANWETLDLWK